MGAESLEGMPLFAGALGDVVLFLAVSKRTLLLIGASSLKGLASWTYRGHIGTRGESRAASVCESMAIEHEEG